MQRNYDQFRVTSLDRKQHERTAGYWYLVTSSNDAHTAFATERGLLRWLQERGLSLTQPLPPRGTWSTQQVQGRYQVVSYLDANAFNELLQKKHSKIKVLDNGEYTLGIVTTNADGSKTVHHLNCNVRTRPVFDYFKTREELDGEGRPLKAQAYVDVLENGEGRNGESPDSDDCRPSQA